MSVKWNTRPVVDAIKAASAIAAERAAKLVLEEANRMMRGPHRGKIYTTFFTTVGAGPDRLIVPFGQRPAHQASAPGEAPAVDTGRLIASGRAVPYPNEYRAVARWTDPAATYMQFGTDRVQPRPFATLALQAATPMMSEVFATEIRGIFR